VGGGNAGLQPTPSKLPKTVIKKNKFCRYDDKKKFYVTVLQSISATELDWRLVRNNFKKQINKSKKGSAPFLCPTEKFWVQTCRITTASGKVLELCGRMKLNNLTNLQGTAIFSRVSACLPIWNRSHRHYYPVTKTEMLILLHCHYGL